MDEVKIGVQLYGGYAITGKKELPLEADELYCDRSNKCSYFSDGKCLNCRAFMAPPCKYGTVHHTKGYTRKAAKYYDFKAKYEKDPLYGKLSYPKKLVSRIADELFVYLGYVDVRKRREDDDKWRRDINGYIINDGGFGGCTVYIPMSDVTNELLYAIFTFKPHGFSGGVIKDWADKRVPKILQEMAEIVPDIYSRFIAEHPEYRKDPDYTGESVYIDSLKAGTKFKAKGATWLYDGEYVESEYELGVGFASPWVIQNGDKSKLRIKVNPKMTITVEDNSIIDENTRFV